MTITSEQFDKPARKENINSPEKILASKREFNGKLDRLITAIDGLAKKIDNFQTELAPDQAVIDRPEDNPSNRANDFWFLKK